MSEFYADPFEDDFVETKYGKIHKSHIPYVTIEPNSRKLIKACLFYSIFVLAFTVIIYTIYLHQINKKNARAAREMQLRRASLGVKKIPSAIEMSRIKVFNFNEPLPIEHIVLMDIYNNVVDIDVKRNYFVERYKIGLEKQGELLDADMGSSMTIKEIVIFIDPDKLFSSGSGDGISIMLELYNFENKVWTYFDVLNEKENSIKIFYEVPDESPKTFDVYEKIEPGHSEEIIISNENALAIKLQEFEETYDGY
jgi:hypothetical protein